MDKQLPVEIYRDHHFFVPFPAEPFLKETSEREKKKKLPERKLFRAQWIERSKWTGEALRAIRRKNGVGSPKTRENRRTLGNLPAGPKRQWHGYSE